MSLFDNPKAVWLVVFQVHYHDEELPREPEKIHIFEYDKELTVYDLKKEIESSVCGVMPSHFTIKILSYKKDIY